MLKNYFKFIIKLLMPFLIINSIILSAKSDVNTSSFITNLKKYSKFFSVQNLEFDFKENKEFFYHSYEPWQKVKYLAYGKVQMNNNSIVYVDTSYNINNPKNLIKSFSQYTNNQLLKIPYRKNEFVEITEYENEEFLIETLRYSPYFFINHLIELDANLKLIENNNNEYTLRSIYKKREINITISNELIKKVEVKSNFEIYGDITDSYTYSNYIEIDNIKIPIIINVNRIFDKINEQIELTNIKKINKINFIKDILDKIELPKNYSIKKDTIPDIKYEIEKLNEKITFINIFNTNDKIMIVSFDEFLAVFEAPINSEYGDLIINEANKIYPTKKIKYFVSSHFHQHYTGGIRAFVNNQSKIIIPPINKHYIDFLINNERTIKPDKLQLSKFKPDYQILDTNNLNKELNFINDKNYEVQIYYIGEKSKHTNDYLIYYFPKEKLLFEGDLIWIPKEGELPKASARQEGLYYSIKELKLDVKNIIQSWPTNDFKVKTSISFEELEKSVLKEK